jgi:hypothetical protein
MFYVRFYKVALISINLLSSWLHAQYVILVSSSFNLITKKDAVPIIRNRIFNGFWYGAYRARTGDLRAASTTLSQLS